jgi:S-adenosylmethionine decarboxylase
LPSCKKISRGKSERIRQAYEFFCGSNNGGLRTYDRNHWSDIIALLNGSILLHTPEEKFDAYLISESSLFVYADRIAILTCGTTTLLKTVKAILLCAEKM